MTRRTRFLVDEHPLIAARWHPGLNGNLDKATIGPGSHRRVYWVCDDGHTWQAAVHSRVAGSGCPQCAGYVAPGRVSLAEHSAHLVAEWHPRNSFTPDSTTPDSQRKVWWRCPGGHEYEARISNRSRGTGCPACARAGILPQARRLEELPDMLVEVDPDTNPGIDPRHLLTNDKIRLIWRCAQGHQWPASVRHRAIAGSGCPQCAGRKAAPQLERAHPGLAAEWHPVRNEGLALEKITAGSHRVAWWRCSDCQGEFRAKIYYRVRGTTRCPHCAQRVSHRDLATESPRIAALWHRRLNAGLTPHQVTAGSNTVVWWSCPRGHEPWRAMVALVFLGHQACPGCRQRTGASRFFDSYAQADEAAVRRARGLAAMKSLFLMLMGQNGDRGLPGGKPNWGPAGRSALERVLKGL
ncbi:zinc-ribbon domain-containing protein [Kitasatospora sp. NPDC008050]|uniref:zinc-ribbon domain-containing protein n=1 Tax=Kitasatospora sp. NPDC008050 TaxID=3364021 RepID=UPI0036E772D8